MAATRIYCISGLGADFRIFRQLRLPGYQLVPIEWLAIQKAESLPHYAGRLAAQIPEPEPLLLGVSFGGMLATELAAMLPHSRAFIISSCKCRTELPAWMRVAGRLHLHRVVPYQLAPRHAGLGRFIFDTRSTEEERYLKQIMLQQTHPHFIARAVHMILHWQRRQAPSNVFHVHGRTDRLLLPGRCQPHHWIDDGGHFMVWNKAVPISQLLLQALDARTAE